MTRYRRTPPPITLAAVKTLADGPSMAFNLAAFRNAVALVLPAAALVLGATSVHAADTIKPTVSITSPVSGATVSGTLLVAASASDNVGVVGVFFKIDNLSLTGEDKVAPYQVAVNSAN